VTSSSDSDDIPAPVYPQSFSLEVTKISAYEECESARILIREGLIEEAKKALYRVLTHDPNHTDAKKILNQIEDIELTQLLDDQPNRRATGRPGADRRTEDIDAIIQTLSSDLGIEGDPTVPQFVALGDLDDQTQLDLAIGYLEMECYPDALRELKKVEKKIRMENTSLGSTGILVAGLIAHCWIKMGQSFDAKIYLEPILVEPEVRHEDKVLLFYEMALVEEQLSNHQAALEWQMRVLEIDPQFKDASYRARLLQRKQT
jgi:tetratricopeptide (TPR) repeat protein